MLPSLLLLLAHSAAPSQAAPQSAADELAAVIARGDTQAVWQCGTPFPGVPGAWQAELPAAGLAAYFLPGGPQLLPHRRESGGWRLGLRLARLERGPHGSELAPAEPGPRDDRVEYVHARPEVALVEWYRLQQTGIEQGFTLERAPFAASGSAAPLALVLACEGGFVPTLDADALGASLHGAGGAVRYGGLQAFDAGGRTLPAWLEPRPDGLAILVDEREACYPITIDPLLVNEEQELVPDDSGDLDLFGQAVAIDGERAVVGSRRNLDEDTISGAAYVFRREAGLWRKEAKLLPAVPEDFGWFGYSVAIDGDRIAVGEVKEYPLADTRQGVVWIYLRSGNHWFLEDSVVSGETGLEIDKFGESVDLSGSTLAVGSIWIDHAANHGGACFVFTRSGSSWNLQAEILPFDPDSEDNFGTSVSLEGDRLAVGSPGDNHAGGVNAGSIYVYTRSAAVWSLEAKLTASDSAHNDYLGTAVAYSGDLVGGGRFLVAGAPFEDGVGADEGAAYVYFHNGTSWSQVAKLKAFDATAGDEYGTAVALDQDLLLVGSPRDDTPSSGAGSAYVYFRSGTSWPFEEKLLASDGASVDSFGLALALSGTTALVGAPQDDGSGAANGSIYFYDQLSFSNWTESQKLRTEEVLPGDAHGSAVAVDHVESAFFGFIGQKAVVGAPGDDMVADEAGAAYVWRKTGSGWKMEDHLRWAGLDAGAALGYSVDIDDDTVVVGAPLANGLFADTGSVFVFEANGFSWEPAGEILALDGATGDQFGHAVAIAGDRIAIGAWADDDNGASSGSVYVYRRNGASFDLEAKLHPSDPMPNHLFGWSVALAGNRLAVGAVRDDHAGFSTGAVYVFLRNGTSWSEEAKVVAGDPEVSDDYGVSVALWHDTLAVGAYREDEGGTQAGAVYTYQRNNTGWVQTAKLVPSDARPNELFGYSVALDGPFLLCGARGDGNLGLDSGEAYVCVPSGSGWRELDILSASNQAAGDGLGWSAGVADRRALLGAPGHDDFGPDSGSAYTYVLAGGPGWNYCFGDGSGLVCPCLNLGGSGRGCANSAGAGGLLLASGSDSVAADDLVLQVTGLPANQFGIFYMAPGANSFPFGDGIRCASPSGGVGIFRYPLRNSGPTGNFSEGPGIVAYTQTHFAASGRIQVGQRWNFQAWFRDPMGPCGTAFNYSNGTTVVFTP